MVVVVLAVISIEHLLTDALYAGLLLGAIAKIRTKREPEFFVCPSSLVYTEIIACIFGVAIPTTEVGDIIECWHYEARGDLPLLKPIPFNFLENPVEFFSIVVY